MLKAEKEPRASISPWNLLEGKSQARNGARAHTRRYGKEVAFILEKV